ncbi:hypothetical protein [Bacillus cihuensis]|nr:hypothetical protein [Bacillus cihuensis]
MHRECRYYDTGFLLVSVDGDVACAGCGAERETAKILDEDEEE